MIIDPKDIPFQDTHKLMIGSIIPRPIALVSTISKEKKVNLAPFSYFNGVCSKPPTIVFCPARRGWDGKEKDTLANIRETKEFVVNIVSESFAEKMVACSTDFDPDVDEYEVANLSKVDSLKIRPPRVQEAKVSFECSLNHIVEIGDGKAGSGFIVIGTINLKMLSPLGRLAGNSYSRNDDTFEIVRKVKPLNK